MKSGGIERVPHWVAQRGTRPGDPVADYAFTMMMSGILDELNKEIGHILPSYSNTAGEECRIPPIVWVDDVAIVVESAKPEDLVERVSTVASKMFQICKSRGLDMNLSKGKSEAMIRFAGPGSAGAARRLKQEGFGSVTLVGHEQEHLRFGTTTKYAHLGTMQTSVATLDLEVRTRIAKAQIAYLNVKKKILENKAIPIMKRVGLAEGIIFSRLLFGSEAWGKLHPKHITKLNHFVLKVYRTILGYLNHVTGKNISDQQIRGKIPCIMAEDGIRLRRLRYLRRVFQFRPRILQDLLWLQYNDDGNSWLQMVSKDLVWLATWTKEKATECRGSTGLVKWIEMAIMKGKAWDKECKRAMIAFALKQQKRYLSVTEEGAEKNVTGGSWICYVCGGDFPTSVARANHIHRAHLVFTQERTYIVSVQCLSCLRHFHTLQRNRQHLQYSVACMDHLRQVLTPMVAEKIEETAVSQMDYHMPWLQTYGPLMPSREVWTLQCPDKAFPANDGEVEDCLSHLHDAARSTTERAEVRDLAMELL